MLIYFTAQGLAIVVGIIHIYILVLEMFLWTTPKGLKTFRMTLPKAEETRVLAANQGLYNGFLASGIFWGLLNSNLGLVLFTLVCVTVAGMYGAKTVSKKIFFVQSVPALLSLLFYSITLNF